MPLTTHPLPFGLRDVKLTPFTTGAATAYGTPSLDLPVSRTFSFSDTEDFEDLQGDDTTAASHGSGPSVEWELESGGLPFECFKLMAGGTVSESGTTPAMKKVFSKLATDSRPYFKAEGQAISDSGGDVHGVVYKCKATGSLEGEFAQGAFQLLSASGRGFPSTVTADVGKLYDFIQNETAIAIT
jgi:hypothetical protein